MQTECSADLFGFTPVEALDDDKVAPRGVEAEYRRGGLFQKRRKLAEASARYCATQEEGAVVCRFDRRKCRRPDRAQQRQRQGLQPVDAGADAESAGNFIAIYGKDGAR